MTDSPGGGRRSPADPLIREAVRRIVAKASINEQVLWFGFDNELVLGFHGPDAGLVHETARMVYSALTKDVCFKALMMIKVLEQNSVRATVLLLGSDQVYALNYNYDTERPRWISPDEFDVIRLHQLRDW